MIKQKANKKYIKKVKKDCTIQGIKINSLKLLKGLPLSVKTFVPRVFTTRGL